MTLTTTITLQPFNGLFSRTTWVSRYQKGKTNLVWQWHQLGHMQVCTSLQTDNHASTPPLCFLQAGCPSCNYNRNIPKLGNSRAHLVRPSFSDGILVFSPVFYLDFKNVLQNLSSGPKSRHAKNQGQTSVSFKDAVETNGHHRR